MKYLIDERNSVDLSVVTDDLLYQTGAQAQDGRLNFTWQNFTGLVCLGADQEYLGMSANTRDNQENILYFVNVFFLPQNIFNVNSDY